MISQALIDELRTTREARGELQRREDGLRQRILDLHAWGAAVEPGPLGIDVESTTRPRLTVRTLAGLLGHPEARRVIDRLPVMRYSVIHIRRRRARTV